MTSMETWAELYAKERDVVVTAWRLSHKDAYRAMNDGVMDTYHGELGGFAMRCELLTRMTAEAAGYPDFATWLNRHDPRQEAA